MTNHEFKQLLVRLNPLIEKKHYSLPMLAELTAIHCFINWADLNTPQNEIDMQVLRDQLKFHKDNGYFNIIY